MKKSTILVILLMTAFWALGSAQTSAQTTLYPHNTDGSINYVNSAIKSDTTDAGIRKDSIFVFLRDSTYYFNGTLSNTGYSLTLKASDGAGRKPILRNVFTGVDDYYIMLQAGNNVYISNLYIDGEGPNPETGEWDATDIMDGALLQAATSGVEFFIDSSVVVNSAQVIVKTSSGARVVKLTNSVFANSGQLSADNIGNGRFIDVRNHATDTIIVKNCTIISGYDNVLRHYNANATSTSAEVQDIEFDHNTIYNYAGANGLFQLGNIVKSFKFTNNLLVDALSLGWDTTDALRYQEYVGLFDTTATGKYVMHLIEHVVYSAETPTFEVSNNVVAYDTAVTNFWKTYGVATPPYVDDVIAANATGSGTTFTTVDPFAFKKVPNAMTNVLYSYKANGYGYTVGTDTLDIDRRNVDFWLDSLDCSYTTANKAFVGTDKLPVGSTVWNSKITAVSDKSVKPTTFALNNNYPNPFNPSTVISFNLPVKSNVTLKVYNILGQEVYSSMKDFSAGSQSFNFNAKGLGSGIYIYTVKAAGVDGKNFTATKKMTLLK